MHAKRSASETEGSEGLVLLRNGRTRVPDRYIDAFCGRVPKSVFARHYTDYSPERLKRIYDKAELRVLN